jgi:hypothetical protein
MPRKKGEYRLPGPTGRDDRISIRQVRKQAPQSLPPQKSLNAHCLVASVRAYNCVPLLCRYRDMAARPSLAHIATLQVAFERHPRSSWICRRHDTFASLVLSSPYFLFSPTSVEYISRLCFQFLAECRGRQYRSKRGSSRKFLVLTVSHRSRISASTRVVSRITLVSLSTSFPSRTH